MTSGIIDSANITRIAPAANDIAIDITNGLVLDRTANPIAVEIVPIITLRDHSISMYFLLLPFDFMPSVEANPSGKFEIKIAAMRTIFTAPPVTKEILRAIFSGMYNS
jgi:hypothetical protein